MSSKPKVILITGASRGLGQALAIAYAGPSTHLILTARTLDALIPTQSKCEDLGAQITRLELDQNQPNKCDQFLHALQSLPQIDLFIANAGLFSGTSSNGQLEAISEQRKVLATNLTGTIHLTDGIAKRMKAAGRGQIALISSLAALQPQADSAAYSASKAGLAAYGLALGDFLAADNIPVSVIYPGHVETDQTAIHQGALPGLISADKAATIIQSGLASKKPRILFPRHIYWLICLSNLLPRWLQRRVNAPFRYSVEPLDAVVDGKGEKS